jgi:hypothetical protein
VDLGNQLNDRLVVDARTRIERRWGH